MYLIIHARALASARAGRRARVWRKTDAFPVCAHVSPHILNSRPGASGVGVRVEDVYILICICICAGREHCEIES